MPLSTLNKYRPYLDTPIRWTSSSNVIAISLDTFAVFLVILNLASATKIWIRSIPFVLGTLESSLSAPCTPFAEKINFIKFFGSMFHKPLLEKWKFLTEGESFLEHLVKWLIDSFIHTKNSVSRTCSPGVSIYIVVIAIWGTVVFLTICKYVVKLTLMECWSRESLFRRECICCCRPQDNPYPTSCSNISALANHTAWHHHPCSRRNSPSTGHTNMGTLKTFTVMHCML